MRFRGGGEKKASCRYFRKRGKHKFSEDCPECSKCGEKNHFGRIADKSNNSITPTRVQPSKFISALSNC